MSIRARRYSLSNDNQPTIHLDNCVRLCVQYILNINIMHMYVNMHMLYSPSNNYSVYMRYTNQTNKNYPIYGVGISIFRYHPFHMRPAPKCPIYISYRQISTLYESCNIWYIISICTIYKHMYHLIYTKKIINVQLCTMYRNGKVIGEILRVYFNSLGL